MAGKKTQIYTHKAAQKTENRHHALMHNAETVAHSLPEVSVALSGCHIHIHNFPLTAEIKHISARFRMLLPTAVNVKLNNLNTEFHYVDIFGSHYYLFQFKCLYILCRVLFSLSCALCLCLRHTFVFQPHHIPHTLTPSVMVLVFIIVVAFLDYDLYCVHSTLECCCSMNYRARELVHLKRTKNSPNVKISKHNSALFPYFLHLNMIHHCGNCKMFAQK